MFKKYDTLVSDAGDLGTVVKLMTFPNKKGQATVKVLKVGLLDVEEGTVVKDFEVTQGLLKFSKVSR